MVNEKYFLAKFHRERGEIDTILEGNGSGMLKMWTIQNLPEPDMDCMIFKSEDGEVIYYAEGTGGFPHIMTEDLGNVNDYAEGLLDALNEEEE